MRSDSRPFARYPRRAVGQPKRARHVEVTDVGIAEPAVRGDDLDRRDRRRPFLGDNHVRASGRRLVDGHAVGRVPLVDRRAARVEQELLFRRGHFDERYGGVDAGRIDHPEPKLIVVTVRHDRNIDGLAVERETVCDVDIVVATVDTVRARCRGCRDRLNLLTREVVDA